MKKLITGAMILLLLLAMGGCKVEKKSGVDRWMELQYNSYKPRLDHMTEKYGDYFEMDLYGQITSETYPDWRIWVDYNYNTKEYEDNFSTYLLREELEEFIGEIVSPVFGECKVYVTGAGASALCIDAAAEDFLTYTYSLVSFRIYVVYTDDYKELTDEFLSELINRGYKVGNLAIVFMSEESLETVERLNSWEYSSFDQDLARCKVLLQSRLGSNGFRMRWMEGEA